jgi:hypothetical protein
MDGRQRNNFLDIVALGYVLLNSASLSAAPPTTARALERQFAKQSAYRRLADAIGARRFEIASRTSLPRRGVVVGTGVAQSFAS